MSTVLISGELSGNIIGLELSLFTDFVLGGVLPSFVFTSSEVSTIYITMFRFFANLQFNSDIADLTLTIYNLVSTLFSNSRQVPRVNVKLLRGTNISNLYILPSGG